MKVNQARKSRVPSSCVTVSNGSANLDGVMGLNTLAGSSECGSISFFGSSLPPANIFSSLMRSFPNEDYRERFLESLRALLGERSGLVSPYR